MPLSISYKDREIHNPILRFLAATLAIIGAVLAVVFVIIFIAVAIVTSPIWLIIDVILKRFNRAGFVQSTPTGGLKIHFDADAFRRLH